MEGTTAATDDSTVARWPTILQNNSEGEAKIELVEEPYLASHPYLAFNLSWGKNHYFVTPPPYVLSRHEYRSN